MSRSRLGRNNFGSQGQASHTGFARRDTRTRTDADERAQPVCVVRASDPGLGGLDPIRRLTQSSEPLTPQA